jgi:hypothetical protein
MDARIGWALAGAAMAVGWFSYGWQGFVLALTVVVFWLLLQFSRALRVMRRAAQAPVGTVPSAVMLHAKLSKGMRMLDIVAINRSLGRKLRDDPETFAWRDDSGAEVEVEFVKGRCAQWRLSRTPTE